MLDWQAALQRQALAEWRDRQVLAACQLMNALADAARQKFDYTIEDASLKDSAWDPAHFADQRINALLRETAPSALERLRSAAAARIAARWMGNAIEPRPVLAQVTDLIDSVCGEARTSIV